MPMIGTIFRFIICITASFCCAALVRFRVRRLLALANARVFAVDRFSKSRADGRCNPQARAKMHRVCEGQIEVLRLTGQKPNQARYPLR